MVFSNLNYLHFFSDILAFATGISLLFIVLISPRHNLLNAYFAIFATVFSVYSFSGLLRSIIVYSPSFTPHMLLNARLLILILLAGSYYFFATNFMSINRRLNHWFIIAIFVIVVFSSAAVATELITKNLSLDYQNFDYAPFGYLLVGIVLLCNFLVLWLVLSKRIDTANWLRLPSILFIFACALSIFAPSVPLNMIIFSLVALLVAAAFMRHQILNPVQELNHNLQNTNEELQHHINELAREKERVEQLNQELVDANRYKDEFFANVSHELRTPLNSIIGYSELLMSPIYGQLNNQQKDRLDRIYRNGQNLSNLIDAVLDINELESSKLVLNIEEFDIHSILENALKKIVPFAAEKNLVLQTSIPQKLPTIAGDAQRIQQAIYNLLENAVKFTQEGQVALQVQVISIQWGVSATFPLPVDGWLPDGRWLLIQVSDTGIGIPPDGLEHIFTNFLQVDGSSTRENNGLGLGLPISKRLVELHHGFIWVESTFNVGSTFYVALPLSVSE